MKERQSTLRWLSHVAGRVRLCVAGLTLAQALLGGIGVLYAFLLRGIIDEAVRAYLGPAVRTVSASACAAREIADFLTREDRCGGSGEERYFTNGDPIAFAGSAARLLGHALPSAVEKTAVLEC